MSSTAPSIGGIRASLSPVKNRFDSFWIRYVLRPLSFHVAWAFVRLGFSANQDGRLKPYNNDAENARSNGLEPYSYLRHIFEKLPLARTEDDYRSLLPQYVDRATILATTA